MPSLLLQSCAPKYGNLSWLIAGKVPCCGMSGSDSDPSGRGCFGSEFEPLNSTLTWCPDIRRSPQHQTCSRTHDVISSGAKVHIGTRGWPARRFGKTIAWKPSAWYSILEHPHPSLQFDSLYFARNPRPSVHPPVGPPSSRRDPPSCCFPRKVGVHRSRVPQPAVLAAPLAMLSVAVKPVWAVGCFVLRVLPGGAWTRSRRPQVTLPLFWLLDVGT